MLQEVRLDPGPTAKSRALLSEWRGLFNSPRAFASLVRGNNFLRRKHRLLTFYPLPNPFRSRWHPRPGLASCGGPGILVKASKLTGKQIKCVISMPKAFLCRSADCQPGPLKEAGQLHMGLGVAKSAMPSCGLGSTRFVVPENASAFAWPAPDPIRGDPCVLAHGTMGPGSLAGATVDRTFPYAIALLQEGAKTPPGAGG